MATARIVFFATQLYALAQGRSSGFGGAETELWTVANGLAEQPDLDVRVVTVTNEINTPVQFKRLTLFPVAPTPAITYQTPWIVRRWAILQYSWNLLFKLRRQNAQVYFSKLASAEACIVFLAARLAGGKYVFRIEHDWETNPVDMRHNIFRGSKALTNLFIQCLKQADLLIVQTVKQADALSDNYGVSSVLIPNAHKMPDRCKKTSSPQRESILWVGRAHLMKRPEIFLRIAKRFPRNKFEMILAPEKDNQDLFDISKSEAERLSNVAFHPGIAPDEIDKYYQMAKVFILTSEAEGFSNVIIEALKNGTPVISLGHNPNSMLLKVDDTTLPPSMGFFVDDSEHLVDLVLARLLTDEDFWHACSEKASKYAEETFSLSKVLSKYRQQLDRLVGS